MTSATNHATLSRTTSACSLPISLSTNSTAVILPFSAIVVLLHPSICERTDDSEAHGGRPTLRPGQASPLHHFYRLDRRSPRLFQRSRRETTLFRRRRRRSLCL